MRGSGRGRPVSPAEKKRAQRRRERLGLCVLKITVPEQRLIEALIETGRLNEAAALQRASVELAASQVLSDFAERWVASH